MLETPYQKKSAAYTIVFTTLVIFLLFFSGLRYQDPPEEYGVAINFGTSDVGSGTPKVNKTIQSAPKNTQKAAPEPIPSEPKPATQEKVLTQNTEQAPVVEEKKQEEKKEIVKKVEKKTTEKAQPEEKEVPKPKKPTPNKEAQNALNNLFGNPSQGEEAQGEGDDAQSGAKGSQQGDPNSNKYYGNDGFGGDGNYLLKGRRALSKPVRKPSCNEEGTVVVRIEVDNNGKVIKATPGIKGTTNNSPCLLEPAKKAALATKWNPDGNAPQKQVGFIRYKFVLSE
ncbi:hypothetical protein [Ochrovirga pacifica]|uniref:hypothetical protein n=1 Tax=Ochrovirga pacifica TaxID=1042376 RepID=UPI000255A082|nr:hypothetical protein [Ochrovirga pacifica]